jgi:hypothetical protein
MMSSPSFDFERGINVQISPSAASLIIREVAGIGLSAEANADISEKKVDEIYPVVMR